MVWLSTRKVPASGESKRRWTSVSETVLGAIGGREACGDLVGDRGKLGRAWRPSLLREEH